MSDRQENQIRQMLAPPLRDKVDEYAADNQLSRKEAVAELVAHGLDEVGY